MNEYKIDLGLVEEWQMIKNIRDLERIFANAKSTIVQGGRVLSTRQNYNGETYTVGEISTEEDLNMYKASVFKYL